MSLTQPEASAERMLRKRIAADLARCGGCVKCVHRDADVIGWGRSICKVQGRTYPLCMKDGGSPGFELENGREP